MRVPPGGDWLVVSDAIAPGWRAAIDGQPAPLVPAFAAFRAVQVPPGAAEVVFRYAPSEWRHALLTTVGGGGAMLLLLAWAFLRRRQPAELPYRIT